MPATLPPLNPLKAFEAAARRESLTLAAEEMNVSQVAVSRQVRVLEEYLDVVLFRRLHRGIELTREGSVLFDGITTAFQDIENATKRVSRRGKRNILAIQSYTTFSQRWLIPRLMDFHETHPKIEVRLSCSIAPVDFETQNLDAAIRSGTGDWADLHAEKLVEIDLVPVCTAAFLEKHPLSSPADLKSVRLLHSMARPDDWASWLDAAGAGFSPTGRSQFENSALAYEAALLDMGVAIAVRPFVRRQLRAGSLVAPFKHPCVLPEAYYLTWPRKDPPSSPLMRFLDWIRSQLAADSAAEGERTRHQADADVRPAPPDRPQPARLGLGAARRPG